jgi:hypothetical protein
MKKQVKFNSTITIHYDPEDLTDDLKEYRKSDVLQRQMDALRMKNLLSPILTLTHRSKIWKSLNLSANDVQLTNDVNTKLEGNALFYFFFFIFYKYNNILNKFFGFSITSFLILLKKNYNHNKRVSTPTIVLFARRSSRKQFLFKCAVIGKFIVIYLFLF